MKSILLIGGGGHCKSVIDTIRSKRKYNIVGILDLKEKVGEQINGVEVIDTDDSLESYFINGVKYAFLTLGSIGNTELRESLYLRANNIGFQFPNIIDETSIVSNIIKIGCGNFIGKGAIINNSVEIKNNCIINTGSIIEHDCIIDSFCHIAPGVTMSGSVSVGANTHIGSASTIIQSINIGKNSMIGAGSVVVKNIDSNKKAYGNPCREVGNYG